MVASLVAFSLSLCLSLVLTPLARLLARRVGLIDRPDRHRKIQSEPIPVAGGLVILTSLCLTVILVRFIPVWEPPSVQESGSTLLGLLLGGLGICGLGVLDDLGRLRGRHKLLGQLVVVGIVIWSGVEVRQVQCFGWQIDLGLLAIPFTAFMLMGAINSLNLIDGMDGLLSSVGAIACLTLAAMAALGGRWETTIITLALAGALLGFLRYNFPPASIYLGDAGSMLIGLVIGVLAIQSSLKGPATVALAAPVGLLAVPIFDTAAAILRRTLTGRSIYSTDRGHLHHRLLRQGYGTRRALYLISGLCLITSIGALASLAIKNELVAIVSAAGVVGILVVGRLFGNAELMLLFKRLVALGSSLARFQDHEPGRGYEVHLQGTIEWSSLWSEINARCEDLSLKSVRLDINAPTLHENYHASWSQPPRDDGDDMDGCWCAEIPLVMKGQVVGRLAVAGHPDEGPAWQKIALLTEMSEEFAGANHPSNGFRVEPAHVNGVPGPLRNGFHGVSSVQKGEVDLASQP